MEINIGVSNRHVHLTEEDFKTLFGSMAEMEVLRELEQPGQFASKSLVILKTDKAVIEKVRVLGPVRNYTQIEISKTDAYKLGINPPIRESGNINGSSPITIIGPEGELYKDEGCIIATRHIHASKLDALKYGLDESKKYLVKVGGIKGGIMNNVSVKIDDSYKLEMHIDTDDANGHLIDKENNIGQMVGEDNESI